MVRLEGAIEAVEVCTLSFSENGVVLEYHMRGDSTGAWNQMNDMESTCVWREFRTDVWSGMCESFL